MWIDPFVDTDIEVIVAGGNFRVETVILGECQQVFGRYKYAETLDRSFLQQARRERITQLEGFEAQIGTVLYVQIGRTPVAVGVLGGDTGIMVGRAFADPTAQYP